MVGSWKFWVAMGSIGLVVALLAFGFGVDHKQIPSPLVKQPAPPFEVQRLNGTGKLSLAELKGTPFILNFWASWCVACRQEAAVLQQAYKTYEVDQKKARVIGIAVQDSAPSALAFAQKYGKTYFLALDTPAGDIGLSYGLYGVPETFFVDAAGVIQFKKIGPVSGQEIQEQLNRMTTAR